MLRASKSAYWVPDVSGGLVTSTVEQRTDWGFDYDEKLAQTAEGVGFEYALSQVHHTASYGAEVQQRPVRRRRRPRLVQG